MSASGRDASRAPVVRLVRAAHAGLAVVSALVLIGFAPAVGGPRVPVLHALMYGSIRWVLFELLLFAVPALFVAMVFVLTGPTRSTVREALAASDGLKRLLVWSWVAMLAAWFLQLAVVAGGVA